MPWSDYKKLREIGSGSFGCAYLVQADKKLLVMKEIDMSSMDQKGRQGTEVEVKVLSSLKHPFIVRYWESFVHDKKLCIVMDYCEGGDLWKYCAQIRRGKTKIPETQVVRWSTQMCLALKYMHDRHVLHRDIKTQNVFLANKEGGPLGSVKIADFGISKVLANDGFARTMVGTPYYLSPEMCQKQPYGNPSDVWALGCVIYELCTLKVPFEAPDLQQLVDRIVRGALPRPPSGYSQEVCEVISACLCRDVRTRPSAAALLQKGFIQREIKQMLGENKDSKDAIGGQGSEEKNRKHHESPRDRGDRGGERGCGADRDRDHRRPLGEQNRGPSPSPARGPSKPGSRAPSPQRGAAQEVLKPSRAPSPVHGDRRGHRSPSPAARPHHGGYR